MHRAKPLTCRDTGNCYKKWTRVLLDASSSLGHHERFLSLNSLVSALPGGREEAALPPSNRGGN